MTPQEAGQYAKRHQELGQEIWQLEGLADMIATSPKNWFDAIQFTIQSEPESVAIPVPTVLARVLCLQRLHELRAERERIEDFLGPIRFGADGKPFLSEIRPT